MSRHIKYIQNSFSHDIRFSIFPQLIINIFKKYTQKLKNVCKFYKMFDINIFFRFFCKTYIIYKVYNMFDINKTFLTFLQKMFDINI